MAQSATHETQDSLQGTTPADLGWQEALDRIEVEATPMLVLEDMLAGAAGEIVLFNDSALHRLSLATDRGILARGTAAKHRTAEGEDVTGFAYLRFDSGVTLYFPPTLDLVLTVPPA